MEPPAPVTKTVFPATAFSQSKEDVKSGRSRKFDHASARVLIEAGRRRSGLPVARWVKVIGWVDDNHHSEICGVNIFAKFVRLSRKLAALTLSNAKNSVPVVVALATEHHEGP